MPLVNYNYSVGATGLTINASSNALTCGCGPYYLEVEIRCANTFVNVAPTPGCVSGMWGTYPWYRSLLNVPGYSAPSWNDQCILEPYNPVFIPFSSLCPGQVYYFRARENVCGALGGPPGAWTAVNSFTTPGLPLPFTGSITTSTTTVCLGGSAILTANPSGGCGTISSGMTINYDWLHIPGTNNPQTITVTPTVSTTYTCIIGNGCGQSATLTAFVAVNGLPAITSTITNPSCFGGVGIITIPPIFTTYTWSSNSSTTNIANYFAGTYSVTATLNGCNSTGTFVLTNPPQLTLTPTANPSTICYNGISTLNANVVGGTPPYNYAWPPTSMTIGTFMVQLTNSTNYFVGVIDANGCTSTSSVGVNVLPPLQTSYSPTFGDICQGGSTTFTAFPSQGDGGPYNITWYPGGINSQTITVSPTTSTTYTLITSDGCSPNDTNFVNVSVNPTPIPSFTTTSLSSCEPLVITYSSTAFGFSNCIWNINGVPTNSCVVTQTLSSPGTYTANLTVIGGNGCIGTSVISTATVFPNPIATFTPVPVNTNILNSNITFNNGSSIGTYNWDFGDSIVSTYTWPEHMYGDTGTYVIKLTVENEFGCKDTAYGMVCISETFSIYVPNVFTPDGNGKNDYFYPVITGARYYEMWIYDRWGENVFWSDNGKYWDGTYKGKKLKQDIYTWKIIVVDDKGRRIGYNGYISLIP